MTSAERVRAAVMPTRPVPEPSSRMRRRRGEEREGVRGLEEGRRERWLSRREKREVAAGQSWKERPWDRS